MLRQARQQRRQKGSGLASASVPVADQGRKERRGREQARASCECLSVRLSRLFLSSFPRSIPLALALPLTPVLSPAGVVSLVGCTALLPTHTHTRIRSLTRSQTRIPLSCCFLARKEARERETRLPSLSPLTLSQEAARAGAPSSLASPFVFDVVVARSRSLAAAAQEMLHKMRG